MMERGDFDLVAIGRAMIVNPDWANKVRAGRLSELKNYEPAALATLV
jgi:2,4-dienoyl-CoA reductase-like NADH-dependent reductase (Old Yellow Enzyme family)